MRLRVRPGFVVLLLSLLSVLAFAASPLAGVGVTEEKTLDLGDEPRDVAATADGQLTFVLTAGGRVLVYSARGDLRDTIPVGKSVDGIEVSPKGDRLFLLSKAGKTLRIVSLAFVQAIDTEGAPFRGKAGAPVVIAVFSDFQ